MTSGLPSKILKRDGEITDGKSIANAFDHHFAKMGNNLALSIPLTSKSIMSYMHMQQSNSLFFNPISSKEVEDKIDKLNSSKSTGPTSIPVKAQKLLKKFTSKPLESIFNSFLLTAVVPDSFKVARAISMHKNVTNYS